jgi:transposase-like protein
MGLKGYHSMQWQPIDYYCPGCGHHPVHCHVVLSLAEDEPRFMCMECNLPFNLTTFKYETVRTIDES